MSTAAIHPVLLCGGSGTRLWPLSRKSYPKQFAKLLGETSLFQATALRLNGAPFAPPAIVTSSEFRFVVLEQLAGIEIAPAEILIEPAARNTAAAVCAAALMLEARSPGSVMLVAPSDHTIPDVDRFQAAVMAAVPAAEAGELVTFGIRPDRPETGYGWLALSRDPGENFAPQPLQGFVEKPDRAKAEALLREGMHLWNAGIFLFSTTAILDAFAQHAPEVLALTREAFDEGARQQGFHLLASEPWEALPNISIDYAVMERARNLVVVPYGGAWSDLGDWQALWRETSGHDPDGVACSGPAKALACRNSLLHASDANQVLVGIGLEDIIAVAMPDAVLVAHKDRAQDVRQAVAALAGEGRVQAESLMRDYRPWGWYESIATGTRFQVKRIVVKPGAALSLQSHEHRAEHWVVVEGQARVTVDGDVHLLEEDGSVYIPAGAIHRMENPGGSHLTMIEVQTGGYLGEDDIVRYEDLYARE